MDEEAWWTTPAPDAYTIGIGTDARGRYFDIARGEETPELELLQVVPKERHLLLLARDGQRFLCGHDERDWFVAAVPERVSSVRDAKRSLMPKDVWERARRLPPRRVDNRKNPAFVRQGEWFFVPTDQEFPEEAIHRNEPLQRTAGSKPHICEELYREGGDLVYIVTGRVYTEAEYAERARKDPERFGRLRRHTRVRDPEVYVRGTVRHEDHATIRLNGWHRVYINAELSVELSTVSVGFLD
jgi:hypothetical protein